MTCKYCGAAIGEEDAFCNNCGQKVIIEEQIDDASKVDKNEPNEAAAEEDKKCCACCGAEILNGEKYCIKCGSPYVPDKSAEASERSALQNELVASVHSIKLFKALSKYAVLFSLLYPLYLLCVNILPSNALLTAVGYISSALYYLYCFGLIYLYAENRQLPLMIAIGLRGINSIVYILTGGKDVSSAVIRIIIIAAVIIILFRKYSKTKQYNEIKEKINVKTRTCSDCGASVKANDAFCPKCGKRM